MVFSRHRITHETQYCVDSAVELCRITGDVATFFMDHWGGAQRWFDDCEAELHSGRQWREYPFYGAITSEYLKWRKTAPLAKRLDCSLSGAGTLWHQLSEISHNVTNVGIDRIIARSSGRKALRRISSVPAVYNAGISCGAAQDFKPILNLMRNNISMDIEEAQGRIDYYIDSVRELQHERDRVEQEWSRCARASIQGQRSIEWADMPTPPRRERKKKSKSLLKAYNFAASLIGEETARAFVSGDRITIEGREMDFIVTARGMNGNYHGWDVKIADKSGVIVTSACVYQDDVNSIDQLSALALHVMVGNETEIIDTANLSTPPENIDHPIIEARSKRKGIVRSKSDSNRCVITRGMFPICPFQTQKNVMREKMLVEFRNRHRCDLYSMDRFVPDNIIETRDRVRLGSR